MASEEVSASRHKEEGKNHHLSSGWVLDRSAVGYVVFCHSLPTDSLAGSGAPLALVVGFSRGHVRVVLGFSLPPPSLWRPPSSKKKRLGCARRRWSPDLAWTWRHEATSTLSSPETATFRPNCCFGNLQLQSIFVFLSLSFGKNSFPKIHVRSVFHIKFNFVCWVNEISTKNLVLGKVKSEFISLLKGDVLSFSSDALVPHSVIHRTTPFMT